ncbi:MAG: DMT family transporter [Desulfovibrionaceae bacterium]
MTAAARTPAGNMGAGLTLSLLSACCYGVLPVLGKLGYAAGLDIRTMLLCRYAFAAAFVGGYILLTGPRRFRIDGPTLLGAALLGGVIYPLQSLCFFGAVARIPASTTTLVFYGYPVTVALLSWAVFHQPIRRSMAASLGLVILGIALVFSNAFLQRADPLGLLLALGSLVVFTLYLILVQRFLAGRDPFTLTFWVLLSAAVAMAVATPWSGMAHLSPRALTIGALLGLVPTALAVTLLYQAVIRIGSAYVSVFSTLEPVVAVLASWAMLGEPLDPLKLAGAALIIAGIVWPNWKLIRNSGPIARA